MKKSVWIFLFAVLLPSVVLGWLALRSAEEQQIVFERRTAELYQKETEALAVTVRDTVEAERRVFGETVRRLLAKGDADALARDFTKTLADAWPVKAVGFAINKDGKLVSPSVAMASKQPELQRFLLGNESFLTSTETAIVYNWGGDNLARGKLGYSQSKQAPNVGTNISSFSGASRAALKDSDESIKGTPVAASPLPAAGAAAATAAKPADFDREMVRKEAAANAPVLPGTTAIRGRTAELAKGAAKPDIIGGLAERKSATKKPAPDSPSAPLSDAYADRPAKKMKDEKTEDGARARRTLNKEMPAPEPTGGKFKVAAQLSAPPQPAPMLQTTAVPQEQSAKTRSMGALQQIAPGGAAAADPGNVTVNIGNGGMLTKAASGTLTLNNANLQNRLVEPQQLLGQQGVAVSAIVPETAQFCSITKDSDDGMVARFVQDRLNLIFWLRPPEAPEMIFGCLVEAGHFSDVWKDVLEQHRPSPRSNGSRESQPEFILALLDDHGKPVATRPASADERDWKHPFVASEIGEALPHWEAALYLASPTALAESARGLWRTLAFTIASAVALIALGGWLVVADARRQLALAQQKTDFVSNVSHELKTPLTSIRMFAELMHDRPQPAEKQSQYLRIITVEAERLTRLINNVLDFAKIGRKQKRVEKKPLDLHPLVERVWESHELHLREAGFTTRWEAAPGPYPVLGDDDALAQVLVNLLSNAEKYSIERKEVELHTWLDDGHVDIAVMDRGIGVPNGDERKIFEAFYRAHDSLNSGIQGSGLGLTLAQRIAHEHGGEIRFERREGGGCRFTLRVPLAKPSDS